MSQPGAGWSSCPGCGLELPDPGGGPAPRSNTSAACWRLYGEVIGYEATHLARLGRYHQLMVDTYGAQHTGGWTRAISVAFGLIGLRLALDAGWRGDQVRDAHRYLADAQADWPAFAPPSERAAVTVFDVAMAGSPDEHAERIELWATAVWQAWSAAWPAVIALVDERLPPDVRDRILAAR